MDIRVAKELKESMAITLVVLGHGMCNKMFQDRFQCSSETISKRTKIIVTLLSNVMS